jgi:hypothetical protein
MIDKQFYIPTQRATPPAPAFRNLSRPSLPKLGCDREDGANCHIPLQAR